MTRTQKILASMCLLLTLVSTRRAQASAAESESVLTLPHVLAVVERSFPLLRAAELDQAVAEAELVSAEGGFDTSWKTKSTWLPAGYYNSARVESVVEMPTAIWGATPFVGWRYGRGEFPSYDAKSQTLEYGEVRAGVDIPLLRNGQTDRRRAALGRSLIARELSTLNLQAQRVEIVRLASLRYWTWVAAGQRLSIARELLRLANDRDSALAERIEQGDLPAFERLDNARAIEQRKAQLAVAQRGVEQAAIDLSLMLRNEAGQPIVPAQQRLPDALPEPQTQSQPLTDQLALAKENRVEPKRFALQADSQEIERAFAKNQLLPGLDLQIAGSTDMGRAMSSRPDLSQPVLELSLFVDVPLQARVMRGRVRAAEAQANRSRLQLDYAHDTIASEVQDAFSALRVSYERIEAARNEVAAARQLEEGERIRFEHGDSQLLIVNLREQQTAEARLREVEALLDHQRAHVMLKAARGELR